MSEFKGTKGEWKREGTIIFVHGGGFDVRNMPDAEENAKLISAAPDLLEALQEVLYELSTAREVHDGTIRQADAAIAKALGK